MKIDEWDDLQIMARTLWGEARGDGVEGIEAVARVIINRFKSQKWFTGYRIEEGQKVADIKFLVYFCTRKKEYNINVIEEKLFNNTTYECKTLPTTLYSSIFYLRTGMFYG